MKMNIMHKAKLSSVKFVVFTLMLIFLISSVSAWDSSVDNYKEVSEDLKTIWWNL